MQRFISPLDALGNKAFCINSETAWADGLCKTNFYELNEPKGPQSVESFGASGPCYIEVESYMTTAT